MTESVMPENELNKTIKEVFPDSDVDRKPASWRIKSAKDGVTLVVDERNPGRAEVVVEKPNAKRHS